MYFTPLLGGLIADRWIGQRNAVVIGAVSMSAGHLAMAFDRSFLLALLLLVVGSGFLKGNISAQVGALYPARTRHGAPAASRFSAPASTSAPSPDRCSAACSRRSTAGTTASASRRSSCSPAWRHTCTAIAICRREWRGASRARTLTAADWRILPALVAVMIITIFLSVAYFQLYNVLPVWIQQHVALEVGGFSIPIPWYQSIDALFSILGVPLLFWLWRRQAARNREPGDLGKIGIGAWLAAASNLSWSARSSRAG